MSDSKKHTRRGPDGKFIHSLPISTDLINNDVSEVDGVGRTYKQWVEGNVSFHPFNVKVLEEVVDRAKEEDNDHVMLGIETVSTKDGAKTGWLLAYDERKYGKASIGYDNSVELWVGSGATYTYNGDTDD